MKNNLESISHQQKWQISIQDKQVSSSRSLILLSTIYAFFCLQNNYDKYLSRLPLITKCFVYKFSEFQDVGEGRSPTVTKGKT